MNVLITGSSSGFGLETVLELVRTGHVVFATMREPEGRNSAAAAHLRQRTAGDRGRVEVLELDVARDDSVASAVARALEMSGRLDAVVNNAGINGVGVVEAFEVGQARLMFETNVFGAMRLDNAVLPHMRSERSGLLLHVSSVVARIPYPFAAIYAASKAALETLAAGYRAELSLSGVDSVVIEPGPYPTEIGAKLIPPGRPGVNAGYGPALERSDRFVQHLLDCFRAADPPRPAEVARAIRRLLETPAGERPFRTVVEHDTGSPVCTGKAVRELNELQERLDRELLEACGIPELSGPCPGE